MERTLLHTGHSMHPTLKSGDTLRIVPCGPFGERAIRPGDVIAFKTAGSKTIVCHRVASIDSGGLITTRGDNNEQPDPWVITFDDVVGVVRCATRGKKLRRIFGGLPGRTVGTAMRIRRALRSRMVCLVRPGYRGFAHFFLFRWLGSRMPRRVVRFSLSDGKQELQLFVGRRMVGKLVSGENRWRIKPPFRLFVDEATLPGKESRLGSQPH